VGVPGFAAGPGRAEISHIVNAAVARAVRQNLGSLMTAGGGVGGGVTRWSGLVLRVLAMLGQAASWLPVVLARMRQESGGNPYAVNLTDINAQRGDPSRGLMQTIGSTFNAYAGPFRGLGIYNPLANIYAGLNYALHRYGTLAALSEPGGYRRGGLVQQVLDNGGYLPAGVSVAINRTGRPEPVGRRGPLVQTGDVHIRERADIDLIARGLAFAIGIPG